MSAMEGRSRRMIEVLWALVAILMVMALFNVCTWPLLSNAALKSPSTETPAAATATENEGSAAKLSFSLDRHGDVLLDRQKLDPAAVRTLFQQSSPGHIEVVVLSESLLALFFECGRLGIAPDIKKSVP
jgi:biopolymer transport protein ExbD